MNPIIGTALGFVGIYRYPLVFATVLVQGPVVMMGTGLLLRLDQFSFWPLYFTLLTADFVGDIIWYFIGRNAAEPFVRRFGHIFGVTHAVFEKMEDLFKRHDTKILFISKITMGFGFALATLMAAGATHVPLKKYLIFNLLGGFIWVAPAAISVANENPNPMVIFEMNKILVS
jgi:membrane protein DedA with SNARE-associated domain